MVGQVPGLGWSHMLCSMILQTACLGMLANPAQHHLCSPAEHPGPLHPGEAVVTYLAHFLVMLLIFHKQLLSHLPQG